MGVIFWVGAIKDYYIIIGGHGEGATAYPLDKNIIIASFLDKYADLKHPNAIENEATKKVFNNVF